MSFIKRKVPGDAAPISTTESTATAPSRVPKFQRRGARGTEAPVIATSALPSQSTQQPTTNDITSAPIHDQTTQPPTSSSPVLTPPTPLPVDPEFKAQILELQQNRLEELATARLDRYNQDCDPSIFESVHQYEIWAIKRYLWLWERELASRAPEVANGFHGKQDLADYQEARSAIRPLIQQIRHKKVKNEILLCVANILDGLHKRDYIQAQQAFLDVAIGNNPWPVGLPKVGIHERRAREKIDPSLVEHILKDPIIQAYMQALKRLMAWVEKSFPPQSR